MRLGNGSGVTSARMLEDSPCSHIAVNHPLPVLLKKCMPKSWDLEKLCLASVQHTGIPPWHINEANIFVLQTPGNSLKDFS